MILKNYQDNTTAQVIFKTDKDTYTLSLNKEEDHFKGTINLPIKQFDLHNLFPKQMVKQILEC